MTRASRQSVRRGLSTAAGALVLLSLAGCGDEPDADADPSAQTSEQSEDASPTASATESSAAPSGDPAPPDDEPFGPDCGRFKTDGGAGPADFAGEWSSVRSR